jgi:hypothetical protein
MGAIQKRHGAILLDSFDLSGTSKAHTPAHLPPFPLVPADFTC